ncbi:MAG TPA: tetratricopeptide repeat protein [Ktedonobacteraceae bacterium]|jgi:predicted ATPase/DNA-binding XRE family transcriptional regulator
MTARSFGALLKQYRLAAGLSQEALAERASISTRAISDLERGINRTPRFDTLEALLQVLALSEERREAFIASARSATVTDTSPTNPLYVLPLPPTQLVGREQEMTRVTTLLRGDRTRLLTIVGPAGVGKTHLALETAHRLRSDYKDGVIFVSLAATSDARLVPSLMAQTLKLRESAGSSPSQQIADFLAEKHLLLVVDNFEQVIDAASGMAEFLQSCPHVRILVTSRTPLRLRGEHELLLSPLPVEVAVALFLQRVQAIRPEVAAEGPVVTAICERLDCLPLAIELAAAQLKVLSLPQLLEQLQRSLPLLQSGARDLPERQQTMEAAIAWSYDLLTPPARQLLRIASVCEGGCTADALDFLGTEDALVATDLLTHLRELVEASLMQSEMVEGATMRFHLLKLVQEYVQNQLSRAGQEAAYRWRHVEYFTHLVERAITPGSRQEWIELEQPNLRAALHWAYEQGKARPGLRLIAACAAYWMRRGQMREGDLWLSKLLALDSQTTGEDKASASVRLAALYCAGGIARHLGEPERSEAIAREALLLGEQTDDHVGMSNALALLGHLAQARSNIEEAASCFEQSYQQARFGGTGDDGGSLGRARDNLAMVARARGNFVRARALLEESLAECRRANFTWGVAYTSVLLGHIARDQQQYAVARTCYRECLHIYRTIGNLTSLASCFEGIAALSSAEGDHEQAIRLCAQATTLRVKAQTPLPTAEQQIFDKVITLARSRFAEPLFTATWQRGAALTVEESIVLALSRLDEP